MTVTVLDPALVAGEAGQVPGERQAGPDPEMPEKARRRTFTAQYKLGVVANYERRQSQLLRSSCRPGRTARRALCLLLRPRDRRS
jgi:hypothetical protein